jgi:hypothetical protein
MLLLLPLFLLSTGVRAAIFPDVGDDYLYREPIEALVSGGVINGNPDGNFYPDRKVNRAEMLKMLYKAVGIEPDAGSRGCFQDVESGSWYESFVCDAAAHHYVEGYGDGTFRPANPVNRVEALKMILQVFGMEVPEVSSEVLQVVKFVDVSISAWYTKYLYAAYVKGILPIAGQDTGRFYPDWPLLRGEAAAMIFNGLNADIREQRAPQGSSSTAGGTSSQATSTSAGSSSSAADSLTVTFPFSVSGKFTLRKPFSYLFTIDHPVTILTQVGLQAGQAGSVSCRLYLIEESGFTYQYYLGFQEGRTCTLRTALDPGNYQLQLQPTLPDTTFTVSSQETTGDGNDGFREAQALLRTVARTGTLTANDYQDWFRFTVTEQASLQVSVSNSTQITCIIYPMEDVTLSNLSGPECNQNYLFDPGTYVVAVGRTFPSDSKQTYTIVYQ